MDNHVPKDYAGLLTALKIAGIDLEIEAGFYKTFLDIHIARNSQKELDATRKLLFKLYYPDVKDQSESLLEEMQKRIVEDPNKIMKMSVKGGQLDPSAANIILNKS